MKSMHMEVQVKMERVAGKILVVAVGECIRAWRDDRIHSKTFSLLRGGNYERMSHFFDF